MFLQVRVLYDPQKTEMDGFERATVHPFFGFRNRRTTVNARRGGGMVDTQALGVCAGNSVWVQVPPPAFP